MAKDLNDLPSPGSRVEEFLEYLAYNCEGGGNTPAISEYIKNIVYDTNSKIITVIKQDNSTFVVDLKDSTAVRWNTLENVDELEYVNIFDPTTIIEDSYTVNTTIDGQVHCARYNAAWNRFEIPCKSNDIFTVIKKKRDSGYYACMGENGSIATSATVEITDATGFVIYHLTIPEVSNSNIVKFNVNVHKDTNEYEEVMVFKGHVTPNAYKYIPFKTNSHISIEGNGVGITYDNSVSNLNSKNYDDAITELALNREEKVPYDGKLIFNRHKNAFKSSYFRIPTLVRTQACTLIAFSDLRYQSPEDHNFIDIGCARSVDNGKTWSNYQVVLRNERRNEFDRIMDTTAIVLPNGNIMAIGVSYNTNASWTSGTAMPKADFDVKYSISTDDGLTWSDTASFRNKVKGVPTNMIGWLGGVGAGIIMQQNESYPNRAILPIQICTRENNANVVRSGCIYSDDNGETWTMSSSFTDTNNSENSIIEVDGDLIMSSRRDGNVRSRGAYISKNGGQSWSVYNDLHGKFTHGVAGSGSGCQGSWIKYTVSNGHQIGLLSHPKNLKGNWNRDTITIYMYDFDAKKSEIKELYTAYPKPGIFTAGYSSLNFGVDAKGKETLTIIHEGQEGILFSDISFLIEKIEREVNETNWEGLDDVYTRESYTFNNLATSERVTDNKLINTSGVITDNNAWKMCIFPVEYGKTYRVTNKRCSSQTTIDNIVGSSTCAEFKGDLANPTLITKRSFKDITSNLINGRRYLEYTITSEETKFLGINIYKSLSNAAQVGNGFDELMIWEASTTPHLQYIEGGEHYFKKEVLINGEEIEIGFDRIEGLNSTKLKDALEEISNVAKNTTSIKFNNIYNPTSYIKGVRFERIEMVADAAWSICIIPVDPSQTYTIYEQLHSSSWIVYMNENVQAFDRGQFAPTTKGGLFRSRRIVSGLPENTRYIALSCRNQEVPDIRTGVMAFEGDTVDEVFNKFIPYNKNEKILFDGDAVDLEFNPAGTNLSSSTVLNALNELANTIQRAIIDIRLNAEGELQMTRVDGSIETLNIDSNIDRVPSDNDEEEGNEE